MSNEENLIVTGNQAPDYSTPPPPNPYRRAAIFLAIVAVLALLILSVFLVVQKLWISSPAPALEPEVVVASSTPSVLPNLVLPDEEKLVATTTVLSNIAVEYLSFSDFYEAPSNDVPVKINDYQLPLNIKIDVMNYYDISRKLSFDSYIDDLNSRGFAVIDNPWAQTVTDFPSAYSNLDAKQVPFLVTSDFLIYYHQNILKKVFKDIEENVFYDNLWDMNKDLYQAAKTRYEARLAAIGNINDPILEAERLETAFFAVSLELLKPAKGQVAPKSVSDNPQLFTASEADKFYFVVPPYLRDDVLAEVSLIRSAQAVRAKSPVLLYNRNYTDFAVPADYKHNAKLNNFYLTTRWLNSVFPLNYQSEDCPDCLLDRADWRINLTAASLIAQDFAAQPQLKSRWARIYKIMSYFKGLREDLNYIHYRDSLTELFGEDFKSEELFDIKNREADSNLDKLRTKLLTYQWPEISGALDKQSDRSRIGLKLLAESYWPNAYIFRHLTTPAVGRYIGAVPSAANQTVCPEKQEPNRCNGLALDMVNLVYPASGNSYFAENSNYQNYESQASSLRAELDKLNAWQANNYWTTLNLTKVLLSADREKQPIFTRSDAWRDRQLKTAASAWINLQLPLQSYYLSTPEVPEQSLGFSRKPDNSYIEPNLPLINEILANNNMLLRMFNALQLDLEVRLAVADIRNFSSRLVELRSIILKELGGESLTTEDNEIIANFIRELKVEPQTAKEQQIYIKMPSGSNLRLELGRLKLLMLVHQEGESKVFSVGPVWDYRESR